VLQEVWSRVYAAVIVSPHNTNAKRSDAEEQAWEAVRRANGGEMPQERVESVICGPREPTDEEMVEALAPIVAGNIWRDPDRDDVDLARQMLQNPSNKHFDSTHCAVASGAIDSWKAARAWGRK
jgi:hypothetical protein